MTAGCGPRYSAGAAAAFDSPPMAAGDGTEPTAKLAQHPGAPDGGVGSEPRDLGGGSLGFL